MVRAKRLELQQRHAEIARHIDVFGKLGYVPTPRQQVFHDATEFSVLYGGAAGGGKSVALLMEGIRCCIKYPGIRVGAFRRSYPELQESLLAELANFRYAAALNASWNATDRDLRFPNGSLMMFRYAETMVDATRRQGGQYQLLLFDELTLTDPAVVRFLSSRIRSGREDVPVIGVRSGSNPGGSGHSDVKKHYIDATDHGANVVIDERGRTVRFIPAKIEDNPHLNAEYTNDLNALDEATRAAMRDGSWTSFSGQVFVEFNRDRHVVTPFEIPAEWIRYGGFDYGWTAPSVLELAARDNDGRLWVYGELTMYQTPEKDQAAAVKGASTPAPAIIAADPAMWGKTGSAMPPASQFAVEGVALRKADNDRMSGKARVHTYLAEGPACAHHRELGWATCPMVHFLDGRCPELIRTLPNLNYDPRRVEDVDTHGEDHWFDACLVAGTLVTTARGDVPIEQVRVGDYAATRAGWRRVTAAGRTGVDRPVMALETDDGRTLTGTGNHPVHVDGRGFVPLDSLRYHDTLTIWADQNPSYLTESLTAGTPTLNACPTPGTSLPESQTSSGVFNAFIKRCGNITTASRSLMDTRFITTITTTATMIRVILFACSRNGTKITTQDSRSAMHSAMRDGSTNVRLPFGTPATMVENGTPNTDAIRGTTANSGTLCVNGAGRNIAPAMPGQKLGSVLLAADPMRVRPAAWMTNSARARVVEVCSQSTSTQKPATARVNVRGLKPAGTADVYNISVDGQPEYFVNGVLVHNCRYLMMAVGSTPRLLMDTDVEETLLDPDTLPKIRGNIAFPNTSASRLAGLDDGMIDQSVIGGQRSPFA